MSTSPQRHQSRIGEATDSRTASRAATTWQRARRDGSGGGYAEGVPTTGQVPTQPRNSQQPKGYPVTTVFLHTFGGGVWAARAARSVAAAMAAATGSPESADTGRRFVRPVHGTRRCDGMAITPILQSGHRPGVEYLLVHGDPEPTTNRRRVSARTRWPHPPQRRAHTWQRRSPRTPATGRRNLQKLRPGCPYRQV